MTLHLYELVTVRVGGRTGLGTGSGGDQPVELITIFVEFCPGDLVPCALNVGLHIVCPM
jgi:hypothetical protein